MARGVGEGEDGRRREGTTVVASLRGSERLVAVAGAAGVFTLRLFTLRARTQAPRLRRARFTPTETRALAALTKDHVATTRRAYARDASLAGAACAAELVQRRCRRLRICLRMAIASYSTAALEICCVWCT